MENIILIIQLQCVQDSHQFAHAFMRFGVQVLEPAAFDAWLAEQSAAGGVVLPEPGTTTVAEDGGEGS